MKTITAVDHALHVEATVVRQIRRVHLQLTGSLTFDLQSKKCWNFWRSRNIDPLMKLLGLPYTYSDNKQDHPHIDPLMIISYILLSKKSPDSLFLLLFLDRIILKINLIEQARTIDFVLISEEILLRKLFRIWKQNNTVYFNSWIIRRFVIEILHDIEGLWFAIYNRRVVYKVIS